MKAKAVRSLVTTGAIILFIGLIGLCGAWARSRPSSAAGAESNAKPLAVGKE